MIRALLVAGLCACPALADDIRPQETARLAAFDSHFGTAMRAALAGGKRGDVDLLQEALAGPALPPLQTTLAGDWRCRVLKLGGIAPLTSYAQFDCRFTADGDGFVFDKLSGSQRTTGRVGLIDGQMVYLGTGYVTGITPTAYDDLPEGTFGDGEQQPQVGVVEQTGPGQARILFPAPIAESLFDVLYLTR